MLKNKTFKNKKKLLLDIIIDECDDIDWKEDCINTHYNCGCCDDCLCDDNIACKNCSCNCNCNNDDDNDNEENEENEENTNDNNEDDNEDDNNNNDFNIIIIKDKNNERKVRITFKFNIITNNKKNEYICIDLDINRTTYLKIAEELC